MAQLGESSELLNNDRNQFASVGVSYTEPIRVEEKPPSCWASMSRSRALKYVTFGAIDGISCTSVLLATLSGGNVNISVVRIIGIPFTLAMAVLQGMNEFFSNRSHKNFMESKKREIRWAFKHTKQHQMDSMVERLVNTSDLFSEDAHTIVKAAAKYEDFFVGLAVAHEIGLVHNEDADDDTAAVLTSALILTLSHAFFGFLPILLYWDLGGVSNSAGYGDFPNKYEMDKASLILAFVSLVGLGAMKSLYTADSGLHSSAEVVLIVGLCTFIAITFARKAYSVVGGYGPG